MPLSISTNVASMAAQRSFMSSNSALETAFERLSSGKRINSSVDDAAGLAIGKDMESRVSGLNQAIRNTNDGISMVQIAEGAMDEATNILQRMRDLAVQAANDSLATAERNYLETETDKLIAAFDAALDRSRNREERHFSFAGNRFSKQSFTRAGLSHHEDAARYTSAQLLEATGVTQKLNQLLYVFLGFIDACNVGKRCRNLVLTQQLCLALTKAHWATTTTAATLHLTHEEHENRQNKQNREARNQ